MWDSTRVYFFFGFVTALLLRPILKLISKRITWRGRSDEDANIYGLEHALLNLQLPVESMWMNMGYWKDTDDFAVACKNLLLYLLRESGILNEKRVDILDLGFGCGEQTTVVVEELAKHGVELGKYVGITINQKQFRFARARIEGGQIRDKKDRIFLFHGDAADPNSWAGEVKVATENKESGFGGVSRWTIALDTLYHFQPSRENIFSYLSRNRCSILAFDLLLSPQPLSVFQRVLLRIICFLGQIPRSNLLTPAQYKARLIAAGYSETDVRIIDISPHVFPGLECFIKEQGKRVREAGIEGGWSKFSAVGKMVGWWARTGVVSGCVVIAKKE
ncbi:hypothetical protein RUND412_004543 [Rhizina undulata]